MSFSISDASIQEHNDRHAADLRDDCDHLARQLARRNVDFETLVRRAAQFRVAIPSWGMGAGGTRFGRFGFAGEPRNIFEKLEDCETVCRLVRVTPGISLHIPWDKPDNAAELRRFAELRGLFVDSMNSNTFQDQPGQPLSYQFGSLSHTDAAVRRQAIEHNLECIDIGQRLGARSHTVWVADGGNFPGQLHFRRALDRYLDSLREIYAAIPEDWRLFIEHKLYEPAFYSTVLNDWGTSYYCTRELGSRAWSLVDLGHHAPSVNVELIVARLIQFRKLGGFHFNDSQYGDDDLDAGSIKPFQLFLIFNELVDAELSRAPAFDPAYMLDQSHNVTDPVESLITSSIELVRAYVQAHLVDRAALAEAQERNDAIMALRTLKRAYTTDVGPLLAMARERSGGAVDPIALYRTSGYRAKKASERPATLRLGAGIV